MRVYFLTNCDNIGERLCSVASDSLVIIGHGAGLSIDLVRELEGEDDVLKRLALYSRDRQITIVAGIEASIYRRKYLSAVVIDKGKIMGISDMTHESDEGNIYNLGSSYRVYKTSAGALGIVVGNDLFYPEVFRTLKRSKSEAILTLAGGILQDKAKMTLKAMAFLNGITLLGVVNNCAYIVDNNGDILVEDESPRQTIECDIREDDTLTRYIRNGIYDNVYIEE